MSAIDSVDVCILGAGIAGLTFARQLKRRQPELDVALIEHRRFPVAEITHKVGESTVEIASHYLSNQLGLRDHLESMQLPKFGLRLFFRGERPITFDLAEYDELGASKVLPIPTYQLDRGRLENYIAAACVAEGTRMLDGSTIRSVDLVPRSHRVQFRDAQSGVDRELRCRYLVDASGRRGLLRKTESLVRPARHNNSSVWFRIAGELNPDDWAQRPEWLLRCHGTPRRLSTNHFTGPGYWLWLIPLSSNATSIGLVYDPKFLATSKVSSHNKFMQWLAVEHPLVAQRLEGRTPLDYHVLQNYAVAASDVFSANGWMLTGDAGLFSDPLYSPGCDFVAIANSYIAELIVAGANSVEADVQRYREYQSYFQSFFSNTLSLYRGQYAGLGNRNFMVAKTLWDYTFYWGVLSKLYFTGCFTDLQFMRSNLTQLQRAAALNSSMQRLFRSAAKKSDRVGGEGLFYDHHAVPLFHELKEDLLSGGAEDASSRLATNVDRLEAVTSSVRQILKAQVEGVAPPALDQLADFT